MGRFANAPRCELSSQDKGRDRGAALFSERPANQRALTMFTPAAPQLPGDLPLGQ